jgi:uncharacterized integral membrane protein
VPRIKIVIIVLVAVLTLIVVLQNTQSVETKILFIPLKMSLAALLFGTATAGFLLGILVAGKLLWKKRDGKKP